MTDPKMRKDPYRMRMKELRREVIRLREIEDKYDAIQDELEKAKITLMFAHGGTQTVVEEAQRQQREIEELKVERDEAIQEASAARKLAFVYFPAEAMFADDLEPGKIRVGMTILFRYGNEIDDYEFLPITSDFHGSLEEAKNEIWPQVILASKGVPLPSDIAGYFNGLTRSEFHGVLHDLAPYWTGDRTDTFYIQMRQECFDRDYDKMAERIRAIGEGASDRHNIHINFNNVINRSFEAMDKRHKATNALLESTRAKLLVSGS